MVGEEIDARVRVSGLLDRAKDVWIEEEGEG